MSPRELRQSAQLKMARGAFIDAIPDLQQLIEYLGDSKRTAVIASLEIIYFNLGLCHFFIGQFEESEEVLNTYLRRYPRGAKSHLASIYIADSLRFRNRLSQAVRAYRETLRRYEYSLTNDLKADIYSAIARCHLAEGKWREAIEPLQQVYLRAADFVRVNWAATLLCTAYFKDLDIEKIYPLVPALLRPNSFASRSVAFNLAALEAGDLLFADERYRDALWVYRMVYPHDLVMIRAEEYLTLLQRQAERESEGLTDPRRLMRLQESIGEIEEEINVLSQTENYDLELYFRLARGYMELMRYWEGREIFLYLYETAEEPEAEEALYLAFQCSAQIQPWSRAYELGEQYMERYPAGEFFDALTLAMGYMYAKEKDWPRVIAHLTRTLEMRPRHESRADCMFLLGYATFMEERFEESVQWLGRIRAEFPASDLIPPATYWTGMALMFDRNYEEAAREFNLVLEDHPGSLYVEDSAFRLAVCYYGMSEFEKAEARLAVFVQAYPESKLMSEAAMMQGDVAGAMGKLDEAVRFYQQSMSYEVDNIEYYNHCAFQAGRILHDNEDYEALRAHFNRYIERDVEGSNIPQAVYWIGVALWNSGEQEGALRYYREAVERFGGDPGAIGVDMILDEWVGRTRRSSAEEAENAWKEMRDALAQAVREGRATMALRLRRVLLFDPGLREAARQRILESLLNESYLPVASPAVLQTMLDASVERRNMEFAVKVARYIVRAFAETDYALDARMMLARYAVERAAATEDASARAALREEAILHLGVISEVYASSGEAGEALILMGRLYLEQRQYEKADDAFKAVLGVRAWRNLWPEALYGRGECAFEQRRFDVASAYYERIYVLYGHYTSWAARAYLRRAECLRRLHRPAKAREVLAEMLANENLGGEPEAAEAREMIRRLEERT